MKPPFEMGQTDHGLHFFMTPPLRLSKLVLACDPAIPFVFVAGHTVSSGRNFFRAELPLSVRRLREPRERTVRRLTMDLLMPWREFEAAVPEIEGDGSPVDGGIRFWQLMREPTARYYLDDLMPESVVPVYRDQGVILSFDLPHNSEFGMIASPDAEPLGLARRRLIDAGT